MTPTTPEQEIALNAVRAVRNAILVDTDKTQLADTSLTTDEQTSYATYRQYLRDLPANMTEEEVMTFSGNLLSYDDWAAA